MFRLIYIGHDKGTEIWQRRTAIHASRLGLCSNNVKWIINPERQVLFTDIDHASSLNEPHLTTIVRCDNGVMSTEKNNKWAFSYFESEKDYYEAITSRDMGALWIAISGDGHQLYLWCGLIAIDQLYYCRETDGIIISNDLRLFVPGDMKDLDPVGFYSLFHFGASSAPFTIFKNVKRVPPSHLLKFSSPDFIGELTPYFLEDFRLHASASLPSETILERALITEIDMIPADSGIFFSGGVDSGLLAALAKRRGRFDLRMINCDFSASLETGSTDLEAKLARDMAAHLGYKVDVHSFDVSSVPKMLEKIGDDYAFPFNDYSTIAENQLVHYAKGILKSGSWVVNGTGADAILLDARPSRRMEMLYRIPKTIRKALAFWYRYERIFSDGGMISEFLGTINETLKVPLMQLSVISKNKLSGSAFVEDHVIFEKVLQTQKNYIDTLLNPFDNRMRLSLLDILWVCTGILAAKGFNPLRSCGLQPFFPFLSERMITIGAVIMEDPRELLENKRVIKTLLLRDVPYEMIYRPKSGFQPPLTTILKNRKVEEYINAMVLTDDNPVNEFVYYPVVRSLFSRIWNSERISKYHLSFLWSYIFSSIWLKHQLEPNCQAWEHVL